MWNRSYIDHVQITAAEDIGIEGRAGYYESSGALRDLVQNHMLQLLALICMEPPVSLSAEKVRDEKVKVTRALRRPAPDEVADVAVRAQYGPGASGGQPVAGYLEDDGVSPDSTTETYVALRLEVSNSRWAGFPSTFVPENGSPARSPNRDRPQAGAAHDVQCRRLRRLQPNRLVLGVQPDEGVSLSLGAKMPGTADADPSGEHGVPLRHELPVRVAGGI